MELDFCPTLNDPIARPLDWDALYQEGIEQLSPIETMADWWSSRRGLAAWYQRHRTVMLPTTKGKTRWLSLRNMNEDYLIVVRSDARVNQMVGMFLEECGMDPKHLPQVMYARDVGTKPWRRQFKEIIFLEATRLANRMDMRKLYHKTLDACRDETIYVQLG